MRAATETQTDIAGINVEFDGQAWEGIAFPVPVTAEHVGTVIIGLLIGAKWVGKSVTRIEFIHHTDEDAA